MRIVLAAPLYPPEIAPTAAYVKELAKRLSGKHQVTIVAYGRLLEKIPGVVVIPVNKRRPLPLRLISYFLALCHALKDADILYAENGASVELPIGIALLLSRTPAVFHIGDLPAYAYAQKILGLRLIQRFAFGQAKKIIRDTPLPRPEIIPFEPRDEEAFAAYEMSWQDHLEMLDSLFNHAH